jgi:hypothetical protein
MTAMSARSASELAHAELATATCRHVRVPGTARTFEVRDQLRGLDLRWDPATHAWHGTIRAGEEVVLERELRVRAQVVHPIEAFATEAAPAPPAGPRPPELRPHAAGEPRGPPRDGSRTRAEARTAYRDVDEDGDRSIHPRFTVWDTASGLPDDSREADERTAERRLRDLRGRVKAARAALSARPVAQEALRADWRRSAIPGPLDPRVGPNSSRAPPRRPANPSSRHSRPTRRFAPTICTVVPAICAGR